MAAEAGRRPPRARLRSWRTYVGLTAIDVVIVGGLAVLGFSAGRAPTLGELGPVATAVTALVALNVGVVTVQQKRIADARAAWWSRAQWALERSMGENVRGRMIGQLAVAHLAKSDLATDDDLALLLALPDSILARVEYEPADGTMADVTVVITDDEEPVGLDPPDDDPGDVGRSSAGPAEEAENT